MFIDKVLLSLQYMTYCKRNYFKYFFSIMRIEPPLGDYWIEEKPNNKFTLGYAFDMQISTLQGKIIQRIATLLKVQNRKIWRGESNPREWLKKINCHQVSRKCFRVLRHPLGSDLYSSHYREGYSIDLSTTPWKQQRSSLSDFGIECFPIGFQVFSDTNRNICIHSGIILGIDPRTEFFIFFDSNGYGKHIDIKVAHTLCNAGESVFFGNPEANEIA